MKLQGTRRAPGAAHGMRSALAADSVGTPALPSRVYSAFPATQTRSQQKKESNLKRQPKKAGLTSRYFKGNLLCPQWISSIPFSKISF